MLQNPGKLVFRRWQGTPPEWKFAPADDSRLSQWLLRFEFARGGTTGHATAADLVPSRAAAPGGSSLHRTTEDKPSQEVPVAPCLVFGSVAATVTRE